MYKFSKPVDTSKYAPLSAPRLNVEGDFVLKFLNQERVTTQKGQQYIEMEFEAVIGPHKGEKHNEQFYVFHDDPEKRAFGMRLMSSVYRALNGGKDGNYEGPESIGKLVLVSRQQDGEYEGRPNYNSRNWRVAPSVEVQAGASAGVQPVQSAAAPAVPSTGAGSSQAATAEDDLTAEDVPW